MISHQERIRNIEEDCAWTLRRSGLLRARIALEGPGVAREAGERKVEALEAKIQRLARLADSLRFGTHIRPAA